MTSLPRALRYETLDHWRGLAALSVVLFHLANPWIVQPAPGFGWFAAIAAKGWLGVHLFFVISGYCVGQLALREIRGRKSVIGFLRGRFLRIFPPYWVACLATAALAIVAMPFNHMALFVTETAPGALPPSLRVLFDHIFLIDPFFRHKSYLLVAWTLSWEISYYLLAGALVLMGVHRGLRLAVGLGLLLAAAGVLPAVSAVWPALAGWSEFMCGTCVLAAHAAEREGRPAWPWLSAIAGLGIAGTIVPGAASSLTLAAAFALLLHVLRRYDAQMARAHSGIWLGWCGTMSYSLYLIHEPVITHTRNLLARVFPMKSASFLVPMAVAGLAGLGAAWLFYRWVESPIERWRKSLEPPRRFSAI